MRQNLSCHIILNAFFPFHQFGVLGFLIIDDITLAVTLNLGILVHNRKTIRNLFQQLLVGSYGGECLGQHRHECRRGVIDLFGNSCIQCSDNSLIDRLICLVRLQLFLVFAGQFLGIFQLVHLGLVIERRKRTLGEHGLDPFLRNGIAALERLHHRIFPVNKLLVPIDFAIFVLCEIRIQFGNGTAVFG